MSIDGQYDPENIFAKILRGDMPCVKVYEDEQVLAFMDIFPQAPGHVLVVPREPARNLLELTDGALQGAMLRVKRIANAVKKALNPDGIVMTQFSGAPAGQTVFHVHFHIIPRQEGEALGAHGGGQADMAELQAQAEKIAAAIEMP
ncbi:MAG: HIT family protein [Maricaulis sp.]|uniref:HIT family protein n=1 Tax=Maricaulis sp. TaxID=1486257 RepID=UPI002604AE52|nr:HIT family protein [Maricaulis sp.]MDM7983494.1 HIT family protein [Maricaulis sp.]